MMASVFDDDGGVCVISVMASTRHYCTAVHWLRWLWSPAIRPVQTAERPSVATQQ